MSRSLSLDDQRPGWRGGLVGVALALLLGGLAYLVAARWTALFPPPVFAATAAPGCALSSGPCAATFDATRFIRLQTEPRMPLANEPLRVLVDTAGFRADSATITLSGIDMNMGLVHGDLLDSGRGSFAGEVTLPACVRRRMTWRATVTAHGADGVYRAAFELEVGRP